MDPILLSVILASAAEATKFGLDLIMLSREGQNSGWTDEEVRARYNKMVRERKSTITEWEGAMLSDLGRGGHGLDVSKRDDD